MTTLPEWTPAERRRRITFFHKSGYRMSWQSARHSAEFIAQWLEIPEDDVSFDDFDFSDDEYVEAVFDRGDLIGFINEPFTDELAARVNAALSPMPFAITTE